MDTKSVGFMTANGVGRGKRALRPGYPTRRVSAVGVIVLAVNIMAFGSAAAAPEWEREERIYYLRAPEGCAKRYLGLTDADDPATGYPKGCGTNAGLTQVAYTLQPNTNNFWSWPAQDVPFYLDGTKPIKVLLKMGAYSRDYYTAALEDYQVGEARVDVVLSARVGDKTYDLGSDTAVYTLVPPQKIYSAEVVFPGIPSLDKVALDSFSVGTRSRGWVVNHGIVRVDDPTSTVIVPTWRR